MHFIVPLWHKSAIGRTSQHTGLVNRFRSRNQQNQYLGGVNEDEMKLTPVVSSNLILTTSPFHRPVRRIKLDQAVPPLLLFRKYPVRISEGKYIIWYLF